MEQMLRNSSAPLLADVAGVERYATSGVQVELQRTLFNLSLCAIGAFLCLYGALSFLVKERIFLNEASLAVAAGIALERLASVVYDGSAGSSIHKTLELGGTDLSRLVLGIQLVLVGIELPRRYAQLEARSIAVLLLPVMMTTWLVTSGLIMLVFPSLDFLPALVLASCVTPTDPILSNAIVKGSFADRHVSPWLRNLLLAESGANDGFAYTFLYLAVSLLNNRITTLGALQSWLLNTCLYQVLGATVFGIAVGLAANRILRFSTRHDLIDTESFVCYGVAVGIFTTGVAGFLDLDDLFAAFVAGNVLTWDDWYRKEIEANDVNNVVDLLLNSVFFLYVGATIPWKSFTSAASHGYPAWHFVALGLLVLAFRRLPAVMLYHRLIPRLRTHTSEAFFLGYFGPIGAGAIFYAFTVMEEFEEEKDEQRGSIHAGEQIRSLIKPTIYALVLTSLIGHSGLIPFVEAFLSWRKKHGSGVYLPGEEGLLHTNAESDEAATTGAGQGNDSSYTSASHDEQVHRPHSNIPVSPSLRTATGENRRRTHDGEWHDRASWRVSSAHMPAWDNENECAASNTSTAPHS